MPASNLIYIAGFTFMSTLRENKSTTRKQKRHTKEAKTRRIGRRLVVDADIASEEEVRRAGDDRFLTIAYPKKR